LRLYVMQKTTAHVLLIFKSLVGELLLNLLLMMRGCSTTMSSNRSWFSGNCFSHGQQIRSAILV
jgi:hypothetical protein